MPLVVLESIVGGPRGLLFAVLLCSGFLAVGPLAYRALFGGDSARRVALWPILGFAAVDLAWVALFGALVPRVLGVTRSVLADAVSLYSEPALFWAASWALGRDIDWELRLAQAKAREQALAREAERAQLLALRNHLDPHFLFNTLNAIAEWCRVDAQVAERATLQLSGMLRTILGGVKAAAWPLSSELDLVRQLLDLYAVRDPQRYMFAIEADPEALDVPVPPMLLLSVVENAVKHGPGARHAGSVAVEVRLGREGLQVRVQNPGVYRGPRPGAEGLPMLENRLRLAYDGQASMTLTTDDVTTTARLCLPRTPRYEGA